MLFLRPPAAERVAFLGQWQYAHRGLHHGETPLENSMPAFEAALDAGYGMECDVRLSSDDIVYIFHDPALDRLTARNGTFSAMSSSQLDGIALNGDSGTIARLSALLSLIDGRAPLLIELKMSWDDPVAPLCRAVSRQLAGYPHPAAIMSFDPRVSRWFRQYAPHIIRGLVVTEEDSRDLRGSIRRHLAMRYAHPDFLAYDIRDLPSPFASKARDRGFPVLSWTVVSPRQWQIVADHADAPIFEIPAGGEDG